MWEGLSALALRLRQSRIVIVSYLLTTSVTGVQHCRKETEILYIVYRLDSGWTLLQCSIQSGRVGSCHCNVFLVSIGGVWSNVSSSWFPTASGSCQTLRVRHRTWQCTALEWCQPSLILCDVRFRVFCPERLDRPEVLPSYVAHTEELLQQTLGLTLSVLALETIVVIRARHE